MRRNLLGKFRSGRTKFRVIRTKFRIDEAKFRFGETKYRFDETNLAPSKRNFVFQEFVADYRMQL